jgi:hypothetical protein
VVAASRAAQALLDCLGPEACQRLGSSVAFRVAASCSIALGPGTAVLLAVREFVEACTPERQMRRSLAYGMATTALALLHAVAVLLEITLRDSEVQHGRALRSTVCHPTKTVSFLEEVAHALHFAEAQVPGTHLG